tara:strand:+ start:128 stop:292 length:165 start_codon:yes stop_codon:yes gene_type:complete
MIKGIRIIEVPLYLLTIAVGVYSEGNTGMAIVLAVASIARLVVNTITDEFNFKR